MDYIRLLQTRNSEKSSFTNVEVPSEDIKRVLECVTLSPTYKNLQNFKIILISDKEVKDKILSIIPEDNSARKGVLRAPLSMVVTIQKDVDEDYLKNSYYMLDGAVVMFNTLLALANEGLSSCWVEVEKEDEMKSILNIEDNYKIIGITPVGYPRRDPMGSAIEDDVYDKKIINQISYENQWGSEVKYF